MTFFDLRLSFARNEVLPKMYARFAAKGGDTLDKKCGDGHGQTVTDSDGHRKA